MSKARLTITVDEATLGAARQAVAGGEAESLSAWINSAVLEKASRDRRIAALHTAIAEYEAQYGEITAEEIAVQQRADRANATVVRGRKTKIGGAS